MAGGALKTYTIKIDADIKDLYGKLEDLQKKSQGIDLTSDLEKEFEALRKSIQASIKEMGRDLEGAGEAFKGKPAQDLVLQLAEASEEMEAVSGRIEGLVQKVDNLKITMDSLSDGSKFKTFADSMTSSFEQLSQVVTKAVEQFSVFGDTIAAIQAGQFSPDDIIPSDEFVKVFQRQKTLRNQLSTAAQGVKNLDEAGWFSDSGVSSKEAKRAEESAQSMLRVIRQITEANKELKQKGLESFTIDIDGILQQFGYSTEAIKNLKTQARDLKEILEDVEEQQERTRKKTGIVKGLDETETRLIGEITDTKKAAKQVKKQREEVEEEVQKELDKSKDTGKYRDIQARFKVVFSDDYKSLDTSEVVNSLFNKIQTDIINNVEEKLSKTPIRIPLGYMVDTEQLKQDTTDPKVKKDLEDLSASQWAVQSDKKQQENIIKSINLGVQINADQLKSQINSEIEKINSDLAGETAAKIKVHVVTDMSDINVEREADKVTEQIQRNAEARGQEGVNVSSLSASGLSLNAQGGVMSIDTPVVNINAGVVNIGDIGQLVAGEIQKGIIAGGGPRGSGSGVYDNSDIVSKRYNSIFKVNEYDALRPNKKDELNSRLDTLARYASLQKEKDAFSELRSIISNEKKGLKDLRKSKIYLAQDYYKDEETGETRTIARYGNGMELSKFQQVLESTYNAYADEIQKAIYGSTIRNAKGEIVSEGVAKKFERIATETGQTSRYLDRQVTEWQKVLIDDIESKKAAATKEGELKLFASKKANRPLMDAKIDEYLASHPEVNREDVDRLKIAKAIKSEVYDKAIQQILSSTKMSDVSDIEISLPDEWKKSRKIGEQFDNLKRNAINQQKKAIFDSSDFVRTHNDNVRALQSEQETLKVSLETLDDQAKEAAVKRIEEIQEILKTSGEMLQGSLGKKIATVKRAMEHTAKDSEYDLAKVQEADLKRKTRRADMLTGKGLEIDEKTGRIINNSKVAVNEAGASAELQKAIALIREEFEQNIERNAEEMRAAEEKLTAMRTYYDLAKKQSLAQQYGGDISSEEKQQLENARGDIIRTITTDTIAAATEQISALSVEKASLITKRETQGGLTKEEDAKLSAINSQIDQFESNIRAERQQLLESADMKYIMDYIESSYAATEKLYAEKKTAERSMMRSARATVQDLSDQYFQRGISHDEKEAKKEHERRVKDMAEARKEMAELQEMMPINSESGYYETKYLPSYLQQRYYSQQKRLKRARQQEDLYYLLYGNGEEGESSDEKVFGRMRQQVKTSGIRHRGLDLSPEIIAQYNAIPNILDTAAWSAMSPEETTKAQEVIKQVREAAQKQLDLFQERKELESELQEATKKRNEIYAKGEKASQEEKATADAEVKRLEERLSLEAKADAGKAISKLGERKAAVDKALKKEEAKPERDERRIKALKEESEGLQSALEEYQTQEEIEREIQIAKQKRDAVYAKGESASQKERDSADDEVARLEGRLDSEKKVAQLMMQYDRQRQEYQIAMDSVASENELAKLEAKIRETGKQLSAAKKSSIMDFSSVSQEAQQAMQQMGQAQREEIARELNQIFSGGKVENAISMSDITDFVNQMQIAEGAETAEARDEARTTANKILGKIRKSAGLDHDDQVELASQMDEIIAKVNEYYEIGQTYQLYDENQPSYKKGELKQHLPGIQTDRVREKMIKREGLEKAQEQHIREREAQYRAIVENADLLLAKAEQAEATATEAEKEVAVKKETEAAASEQEIKDIQARARALSKRTKASRKADVDAAIKQARETIAALPQKRDAALKEQSELKQSREQARKDDYLSSSEYMQDQIDIVNEQIEGINQQISDFAEKDVYQTLSQRLQSAQEMQQRLIGLGDAITPQQKEELNTVTNIINQLQKEITAANNKEINAAFAGEEGQEYSQLLDKQADEQKKVEELAKQIGQMKSEKRAIQQYQDLVKRFNEQYGTERGKNEIISAVKKQAQEKIAALQELRAQYKEQEQKGELQFKGSEEEAKLNAEYEKWYAISQRVTKQRALSVMSEKALKAIGTYSPKLGAMTPDKSLNTALVARMDAIDTQIQQASATKSQAETDVQGIGNQIKQKRDTIVQKVRADLEEAVWETQDAFMEAVESGQDTDTLLLLRQDYLESLEKYRANGGTTSFSGIKTPKPKKYNELLKKYEQGTEEYDRIVDEAVQRGLYIQRSREEGIKFISDLSSVKSKTQKQKIKAWTDTYRKNRGLELKPEREGYIGDLTAEQYATALPDQILAPLYAQRDMLQQRATQMAARAAQLSGEELSRQQQEIKEVDSQIEQVEQEIYRTVGQQVGAVRRKFIEELIGADLSKDIKTIESALEDARAKAQKATESGDEAAIKSATKQVSGLETTLKQLKEQHLKGIFDKKTAEQYLNQVLKEWNYSGATFGSNAKKRISIGVESDESILSELSKYEPGKMWGEGLVAKPEDIADLIAAVGDRFNTDYVQMLIDSFRYKDKEGYKTIAELEALRDEIAPQAQQYEELIKNARSKWTKKQSTIGDAIALSSDRLITEPDSIMTRTQLKKELEAAERKIQEIDNELAQPFDKRQSETKEAYDKRQQAHIDELNKQRAEQVEIQERITEQLRKEEETRDSMQASISARVSKMKSVDKVIPGTERLNKEKLSDEQYAEKVQMQAYSNMFAAGEKLSSLRGQEVIDEKAIRAAETEYINSIMNLLSVDKNAFSQQNPVLELIQDGSSQFRKNIGYMKDIIDGWNSSDLEKIQKQNPDLVAALRRYQELNSEISDSQRTVESIRTLLMSAEERFQKTKEAAARKAEEDASKPRAAKHEYADRIGAAKASQQARIEEEKKQWEDDYKKFEEETKSEDHNPWRSWYYANMTEDEAIITRQIRDLNAYKYKLMKNGEDIDDFTAARLGVLQDQARSMGLSVNKNGYVESKVSREDFFKNPSVYKIPEITAEKAVAAGYSETGTVSGQLTEVTGTVNIGNASEVSGAASIVGVLNSILGVVGQIAGAIGVKGADASKEGKSPYSLPRKSMTQEEKAEFYNEKLAGVSGGIGNAEYERIVKAALSQGLGLQEVKAGVFQAITETDNDLTKQLLGRFNISPKGVGKGAVGGTGISKENRELLNEIQEIIHSNKGNKAVQDEARIRALQAGFKLNKRLTPTSSVERIDEEATAKFAKEKGIDLSSVESVYIDSANTKVTGEEENLSGKEPEKQQPTSAPTQAKGQSRYPKVGSPDREFEKGLDEINHALAVRIRDNWSKENQDYWNTRKEYAKKTAEERGYILDEKGRKYIDPNAAASTDSVATGIAENLSEKISQAFSPEKIAQLLPMIMQGVQEGLAAGLSEGKITEKVTQSVMQQYGSTEEKAEEFAQTEFQKYIPNNIKQLTSVEDLIAEHQRITEAIGQYHQLTDESKQGLQDYFRNLVNAQEAVYGEISQKHGFIMTGEGEFFNPENNQTLRYSDIQQASMAASEGATVPLEQASTNAAGSVNQMGSAAQGAADSLGRLSGTAGSVSDKAVSSAPVDSKIDLSSLTPDVVRAMTAEQKMAMRQQLLDMQARQEDQTADGMMSDFITDGSTGPIDRIGASAVSANGDVQTLASTLSSLFAMLNGEGIEYSVAFGDSLEKFGIDTSGHVKSIDEMAIARSYIANLENGGYFQFHNHPSGSDLFSPEDMEVISKSNMFTRNGSKLFGVLGKNNMRFMDLNGTTEEQLRAFTAEYKKQIEEMVEEVDNMKKKSPQERSMIKNQRGESILNTLLQQHGLQDNMRMFGVSQTEDIAKYLLSVKAKSTVPQSASERLINAVFDVMNESDKDFIDSDKVRALLSSLDKGKISGSEAYNKLLGMLQGDATGQFRTKAGSRRDLALSRFASIGGMHDFEGSVDFDSLLYMLEESLAKENGKGKSIFSSPERLQKFLSGKQTAQSRQREINKKLLGSQILSEDDFVQLINEGFGMGKNLGKNKDTGKLFFGAESTIAKNGSEDLTAKYKGNTEALHELYEAYVQTAQAAQQQGDATQDAAAKTEKATQSVKEQAEASKQAADETANATTKTQQAADQEKAQAEEQKLTNAQLQGRIRSLTTQIDKAQTEEEKAKLTEQRRSYASQLPEHYTLARYAKPETTEQPIKTEGAEQALDGLTGAVNDNAGAFKNDTAAVNENTNAEKADTVREKSAFDESALPIDTQTMRALIRENFPDIKLADDDNIDAIWTNYGRAFKYRDSLNPGLYYSQGKNGPSLRQFKDVQSDLTAMEGFEKYREKVFGFARTQEFMDYNPKMFRQGADEIIAAQEKLAKIKSLQLRDENGASAFNAEQIREMNAELKEQMTIVDKYRSQSAGRIQLEGFDIKGDFSTARAEMEAYVRSLDNGSVAIQKFSKNGQQLTYTLRTADNMLETHIVSVDKTGHMYDELSSVTEYMNPLQKALGGLGAKFREISRYFIASTSIYRMVGMFKQLITQVSEMDTAMTNLRKVAEGTTEEFGNFQEKSFDIAKQTGSTAKSVVEAATEWARLGYNLEDAAELSKASIVYSNVGELEADKATTDLVAALKAFDLDKSQAMHVVDILNEIGNNYAVSSAQLGEVIEKSASALTVSGDDLEHVTAMAAAMNEVVQDASVTGSTLKVVGLRLRGAKTELTEQDEDTEGMATSTSKLRAKIKALTNVNGTGGFDIMLDDKTFKTTYDILKGISEVWSDMSQIDQSALLELIAGKNRAQGVAALIKNFETAENALQDAYDSEGSAEKENEKYIDSIQGKIAKFKNEIQDLSNSALQSNDLKIIIDFGTQALSIVNKLVDSFGGLRTILSGIAAIFMQKNGLGKPKGFPDRSPENADFVVRRTMPRCGEQRASRSF